MKKFILLILVIGSAHVFAANDCSEPNDVKKQILNQIDFLQDEINDLREKRPDALDENSFEKSAGIANELLIRAEQKALKKIPTGRFEWSWAGIEAPEGLIDHAKQILSSLKKGIDPFEGRFAEPGGYVIDHAIIRHGNSHHVFYILGKAATTWSEYRQDKFGHASSTDLKNWKIHKPVLYCPESGWDSYQVWAPHIIKHKDKYWMFYTGVNYNCAQQIGIAVSEDLYDWHRVENNPVINTEDWGVWDANSWSNCRDPMVLQDGDIFYCYYTAARLNEKGEIESCVGISSSTNLLDWNYAGFIRLEQSLATPPESPFVVKKNKKFHLFYTNYRHGIARAISNDPVKGWQELPKEKMTVLSGASASEIYQAGGDWYISYISHDKNHLHFLEVRRLIWKNNNVVTTESL